MEKFKVGEVARQAGVNLQTLHYYERRGLLPKPPRSVSNYRLYPEDTARRIHFIKRAQGLGFSLSEVAELLDFRVEPCSACEEVRKQAEKKRREVEEKIRSLEAIRAALEQLIAACETRDLTGECPILDALEGGDKER